jgi:hypothetical protein
MMSSEIGERVERSVTASNRWWAVVAADDCLFICADKQRNLKLLQGESIFASRESDETVGGLAQLGWQGGWVVICSHAHL